MITSDTSLRERDLVKLAIALTVYLTSLFAANTLGLKIMPFIFGTHLSVGVFCFPVVFCMTDVIGEVYGKKIARMFVAAGCISILLFILYSLISLATPWAAAGMWAQSSYNTIFGISLRISIASIIAYAVGEYQDLWSFFFLTAKFEHKWFWLRSNLSNLWSQLFDTVLFMTIAFYGVYPNGVLLSIIFTWWLFKVLMGICYTPFSYLGLYLLRKE
jgi:hypothetical protein